MQAPRHFLRKQKITPVAGDEVTLETENGASVIAQIAPRKNVFVRPPVANLDVLLLVASTTQPTPSTLVLDKLSAIAVDKGVQPVIVCTKGDLAEAEFLRSAYEKSTLPFIRIDYGSGAGLDEVKQWISGRLCAFCGNSGVGKSTLLNALLPDAARETSAISQKLGRGRHTTREVTILKPLAAELPTRRALPAWKQTGQALSLRKIWSTPSRSSGPIWGNASSPVAPTGPKRDALCGRLLPRASSPRPGTTATAPCTMRSRTSRTGSALNFKKQGRFVYGTVCDPFGLPGLSGAGRSAAGR